MIDAPKEIHLRPDDYWKSISEQSKSLGYGNSIDKNPLINSANRNLFAEDVLDILKRKRVTFRGCSPCMVEVKLDGGVKVWFEGDRIGVGPWRGGVSFNCVRPEDRVYMTDPAVVAEMCERHIALMNAG